MSELSNAAAAFDVLRQIVLDIDDDQLGRPTPCRDFDVAALAEHLIASVGSISAACDVMVPPSVDGAVLSRVLDTGRRALVGWRERGVDGEVSFGGRTLAARDLLGVIALESPSTLGTSRLPSSATCACPTNWRRTC